VKFGVFDHLDDAGVPYGALYADRLQFAEALDRGGFHAYHLAEHHGTPLGMAAPRRCASGQWFTCCRSIIRCA
jgi:alkanesulfonate monooxygenase SsuD/methylene tetrahydromethanopterin reductase-like flavin-dependent oxidoreductase (luciferase family)